MSLILAPSLLSADFTRLGAECEEMDKAGIPWLHLDIMDGVFAPNITFGPPVIKSLRKCCSMFFDAHLMVENPSRFYQDFTNAGADLLVPHIEAMRHPQRELAQIHELGAKAGVALNPDTDFSRLKWLLPDIDLILLMSVNPGFSGQSFINQSYEKLRLCRLFLDEAGFENIAVEVDGGVSIQNARKLLEAGADILVSGSAFFNFNNAKLAWAKFNEAAGDRQFFRTSANIEFWKHSS